MGCGCKKKIEQVVEYTEQLNSIGEPVTIENVVSENISQNNGNTILNILKSIFSPVWNILEKIVTTVFGIIFYISIFTIVVFIMVIYLTVIMICKTVFKKNIGGVVSPFYLYQKINDTFTKAVLDKKFNSNTPEEVNMVTS